MGTSSKHVQKVRSMSFLSSLMSDTYECVFNDIYTLQLNEITNLSW